MMFTYLNLSKLHTYTWIIKETPLPLFVLLGPCGEQPRHGGQTAGSATEQWC